MTDDAEWVTDSNEALELCLVRALEDADALVGEEERGAIEPFNPQFTYPIFGEQEKIFGYKDLEIKLHFASGSLKQLLEIKYSAKLESAATPADDIEGLLYKFIPADYTKHAAAFEATVEADYAFRPVGEKVGSYARAPAGKARAKGKGKGKARANGRQDVDEEDGGAVVFEMFKSTWATPGFREYHRRMQLFILLFIEGGSYVHEEEDAWEFITLYERRKRPSTGEDTYHFVGYVSTYPFWCYPDQVRLRLSQFVILPPYQHQGHGSKLYATLFKHMLARPEVAELTVEDPAEAFEDLRDRNDLRYLVAQGVPDDPAFTAGVGEDRRGPRAAWETGVRRRHKIAQRQFDRLLEMLLLRQLDKSEPAKVRAYRLQVKARLYRFNYMTPDERKEALAKTYDSVVEDYERILDMTFH